MNLQIKQNLLCHSLFKSNLKQFTTKVLLDLNIEIKYILHFIKYKQSSNNYLIPLLYIFLTNPITPSLMRPESSSQHNRYSMTNRTSVFTQLPFIEEYNLNESLLSNFNMLSDSTRHSTTYDLRTVLEHVLQTMKEFMKKYPNHPNSGHTKNLFNQSEVIAPSPKSKCQDYEIFSYSSSTPEGCERQKCSSRKQKGEEIKINQPQYQDQAEKFQKETNGKQKTKSVLNKDTTRNQAAHMSQGQTKTRSQNLNKTGKENVHGETDNLSNLTNTSISDEKNIVEIKIKQLQSERDQFRNKNFVIAQSYLKIFDQGKFYYNQSIRLSELYQDIFQEKQQLEKKLTSSVQYLKKIEDMNNSLRQVKEQKQKIQLQKEKLYNYADSFINFNSSISKENEELKHKIRSLEQNLDKNKSYITQLVSQIEKHEQNSMKLLSQTKKENHNPNQKKIQELEDQIRILKVEKLTIKQAHDNISENYIALISQLEELSQTIIQKNEQIRLLTVHNDTLRQAHQTITERYTDLEANLNSVLTQLNN